MILLFSPFNNYVSYRYIHVSLGKTVATSWERAANSACHLLFCGWLMVTSMETSAVAVTRIHCILVHVSLFFVVVF